MKYLAFISMILFKLNDSGFELRLFDNLFKYELTIIDVLLLSDNLELLNEII